MRNHARRVLQVLWPCLITGSYAVAPAAEEKPNSVDAHTRYEHRQQHDPDGIGKFYLGREIAHVMGHLAADWLERPEREQEERTSKLLPALKLKAGDVVADVGAGSGYYTFSMSKLVGNKGKVYAVDIQPEMLKIIQARIKLTKVTNVVPVKGTLTDPKL